MTQLRVTLVQTALAWESPDENLVHFDSILNGISTDLIVLPEMFSTGFSMSSATLAESMDGPTVKWMFGKARSLGAVICGSVIIEDGGRFFNRFVWMPPSGVFQHYDKRHLFRMSTENEHYTSGNSRQIMEIKGFRVCPQVCYDLRFPVFSRNDDAYDVLLYVANWPATRREHWRSLLKARAVENLSFVVGVNRIGVDGNDIDYAGDSVIHDYNGMALTEMASEDAVNTVILDLHSLVEYRKNFPAYLDADSYKIDL
jgi:omega-amidase